MMSTMTHRGIVAISSLALAVGLALAGCTAAPQPLATLEPVASETPTSESTEPNGTVLAPYDFGVLAPADPTGSQWDVTITEPLLDGTAQAMSENQFNAAPAVGTQFVMGRLTAIVNENLTSENAGIPIPPQGSLQPVFIGSDGKIYDLGTGSSFASIGESWNSIPEIINNPGVESSGRFAIEVPTSAATGGHFGIRNSVSGHINYFGGPQ